MNNLENERKAIIAYGVVLGICVGLIFSLTEYDLWTAITMFIGGLIMDSMTLFSRNKYLIKQEKERIEELKHKRNLRQKRKNDFLVRLNEIDISQRGAEHLYFEDWSKGKRR